MNLTFRPFSLILLHKNYILSWDINTYKTSPQKILYVNHGTYINLLSVWSFQSYLCQFVCSAYFRLTANFTERNCFSQARLIYLFYLFILLFYLFIFIQNLVLTDPIFLWAINKDGNAKSGGNVWIYDVNLKNIVEKFMETPIKLFCRSILYNFLKIFDHWSWSTDIRSSVLATLTTVANRCLQIIVPPLANIPCIQVVQGSTSKHYMLVVHEIY